MISQSAAHMPGVSVLDVDRKHGSFPRGPLQRAAEWPHRTPTSFPQSGQSTRESKEEAHPAGHDTTLGCEFPEAVVVGALLEAGYQSFFILSLMKKQAQVGCS